MQRAPLPLDIVVVGGGIGGLAVAHTLSEAGHRVTIVEKASRLEEVGAGLQISPNASRILAHWGLGPQLASLGVTPTALAIHRYSDGTLIGWTRAGDAMQESYGAPYCNMHRADLHALLLGLVRDRVTIKLNSNVVDVQPSTPSVTLGTGEQIHADLVIGADGHKSTVRDAVLGEPAKVTPTGDACYRFSIPLDKLREDPDLESLVTSKEVSVWLGPGHHIVAYNLLSRQLYNVAIAHPDNGSVESWTVPGEVGALRETLKVFEPRIQKLLQHVTNTLDGKLMDHLPLSTWVHRQNKVVLLGDAAHPMLPYRAQGCAMTLEDAAVLGALLSRISSREELPVLLRGYESLRLGRTAEAQAASRQNQKTFHLPDGPIQEMRDASMRKARDVALSHWDREDNCPRVLDEQGSEAFTGSGSANQWADRARNDESFLYDAYAEAEKWWNEHGDKLCTEVRANTP